MELYEAINNRHTIRDFKEDDIDDELVRRIVSAGLKAPTNDHMRDWHFVVIKDKEVVKKLIELIPMKVSEEELSAILRDWNLNDSCQQACYGNAVPKQYRMFLEASCVVIPLLKQKTDLLHPDNLSHLNGFASIWCCIENMFLAAVEEQYACTLRIPLGEEGEWAKKVLGFPTDYLMPCMIAIGKPADKAKMVVQKEIKVEERIHWNRW